MIFDELYQEGLKLYSDQPQSKRYKILAYGETGAGKTHFISTCPKPLVLDTDGSLSGAAPVTGPAG